MKYSCGLKGILNQSSVSLQVFSSNCNIRVQIAKAQVINNLTFIRQCRSFIWSILSSRVHESSWVGQGRRVAGCRVEGPELTFEKLCAQSLVHRTAVRALAWWPGRAWPITAHAFHQSPFLPQHLVLLKQWFWHTCSVVPNYLHPYGL